MTAYVCHREDCPAYLMYLQSRGVDYEKDYCWTWQGRILDTGYGQGWCPCIKKNLLAHRLAYSLEDCGKIPEGLQIDHFCRNRSCINPQHMELVTSKENTLRGEGPTG